MRNLAKSFAAVWYPIFIKAGLAVEWPEPYILYTQANPPKVHAPHRKAIPAPSSTPEKEAHPNLRTRVRRRVATKALKVMILMCLLIVNLQSSVCFHAIHFTAAAVVFHHFILF